MPDYVVMSTTLGGMAVLSINGFVVGPTIPAMFMSVWHIFVAAQGETVAPVSAGGKDGS